MERAELEQNLKSLHEELERTPAVDDHARELLVAVLADIERILQTAPAKTDHQTQSLMERLQSTTEHFEESHPFLSTLIGRIADSLSNMGI